VLPHREDERDALCGVARDHASREDTERAAGEEDAAAIGDLIGVAERIDRLVGDDAVLTRDPDLSSWFRRGTESAGE
jgi:hypothetical protein